MAFDPFRSLPPPTPDPLFAIGDEAKRAGPSAINGTLGVVMDETGNPLLFPSVAAALQDLSREMQSMNYAYPALVGLSAYRQAVMRLLPKPQHLVMASIATTGGTGALAVNLRLMSMLLGTAAPRLLLPIPAWGNHPPLCRGAGFSIINVPYLRDGIASIDALTEAIALEDEPFGLLLQVGCHNPTGLDFTREQWCILAETLAHKRCVALLDLAYQGFIGEPEDDDAAIDTCLQHGIPSLVTWSASKNHSIYGLRTGLAAAYVTTEAMASIVEGHYSSITRTLHSAASTFGQHVVAHVQEHYQEAWRRDLRAIRSLLDEKRRALSQALPETFSASLRGHGMFAMLPLSPEQLLRLKEQHNVYLVQDGRLNIAGIPLQRIDELAESIRAVCK